MNKYQSSAIFDDNNPHTAETENENYEANNESEQSKKVTSSYLINKTQVELLLNAAKELGLRT